MRWRLAFLVALWSATLARPLHAPAAHLPGDRLPLGLLLQPSLLEVEGCSGLPQAHTFHLLNNTGADGTFTLDYLVPGGDGTLTGPPQVVVADGQAAAFSVVLTPALCLVPGVQVHAQVAASGNGSTSLANIAQLVYADPHWQLAPEHPRACFDWLVESALDPDDGREYLYVAGCDTLSTYRYDPRAGTWTTLAGTLPGYLREAGDGVAFQGRIYARSDGQASLKRQLYTYDIGSDTWSAAGLPPGIVDRSGYDAVELEGQIYFLGGVDPYTWTFSGAVDRYDPGSGAWLAAAPLLHPRAFAMAWADGHQIYVAGGIGAAGPLTSTEVYDPATGNWTEDPGLFAPLPAPRYAAGDAVLDGRLWVIGGFDTGDSDRTLYWSPAGNAWQPGPALAVAASRSEAAALAAGLYTVGGLREAVPLDDHQRLAACPDRGECRGGLEGQIYDAELPATTPACTAPSLTLTPGGSVPVAPLTGRFGPLSLLPAAYLLEASAPGYSLEPAEVTVEAGITTTRDIGLWRPRVSAGPAHLRVAADPGAVVSAPLWITNTGHLALAYELVELAPSSAGCLAANGDELPWLSPGPSAGEIAPTQAATVELTFLCTAAQAGQVLAGTLRLLHSDPCAAPLEHSLEFACGSQAKVVYLPLLMATLDPAPSSTVEDTGKERGSPAR